MCGLGVDEVSGIYVNFEKNVLSENWSLGIVHSKRGGIGVYNLYSCGSFDLGVRRCGFSYRYLISRVPMWPLARHSSLFYFVRIGLGISCWS